MIEIMMVKLFKNIKGLKSGIHVLPKSCIKHEKFPHHFINKIQ